MPTLNNDRFLVLRRDGSVAGDVFVLCAEDPCASAALQAYAGAAETFQVAAPCESEALRELAAEWGNRPSPGTPETVCQDNPNIVGAIEQPPATGVQALVYGAPPGPP